MVARDSTANTPGPLTSSRLVSGKPEERRPAESRSPPLLLIDIKSRRAGFRDELGCAIRPGKTTRHAASKGCRPSTNRKGYAPVPGGVGRQDGFRHRSGRRSEEL